jgi:N-methylhydantoinase A
VTDANLILGRLDPSQFLGGEMALDGAAARAAIRRRIGEPLGLTEVEAALAIIEITVMNMSLAVRQISVERGYDPRDFAIVAFGGAGPLHAVQIARSLHIPTIIIPNFPGQFSASGMLIADLRHDFVRTYYRPLDRIDFPELRSIVEEMTTLGRLRLCEERVSESRVELHYFLDVRYAGQDFSLSVPVEPERFGEDYRPAIRRAFNELHQHKFGYHDIEQLLEVVSARVSAVAFRKFRELPAIAGQAEKPVSRRAVYLESPDRPEQCAVYQREALAPGTQLQGPCIIQEYASTTVLFFRDRAEVAASGELIVQVGSSQR